MAASEIYDYVSTVTADVDQTLSVEPQSVLNEVGQKKDSIIEFDDSSEERIDLSEEFIFYIILRYDLLTATDIGTIFDLYFDSTKANARINSFKFSHPDGHTYVVRFDTSFSRDMYPTYYSARDIRLKVIGRIVDA